MDSVIVDSMQHARQCIEHLKDRVKGFQRGPKRAKTRGLRAEHHRKT